MNNVLFVGNIIRNEYIELFEKLIFSFIKNGFTIVFNKELHNFFIESNKKNFPYYSIDSITEKDTIQYVVSIGGDGTLLRSAHLVGKKNIPILGINFGRLGFLADNSLEQLDTIAENLKNKDYRIEERTLIELHGIDHLNDDETFALNEITIQKNKSSHLLAIHITVDSMEIGTFWADGILVATPTGSTAYSLSLGGPIILPSTKTLIINPIAPHSLTARPMIIPDSSSIQFTIESPEQIYNVTLDSRTVIVEKKCTISLSKATFTIKLIKFANQNFFVTLKNKLMWGADLRNR